MRWMRFAVLVLLATIAQAGILDIMSVSKLNIKADLLIILLTFFAIYFRTSDAIITSFTLGFASDLISSFAMGPGILSFGIIGTLLAYLSRVIAIRKVPFQIIAIFITAFFTGLLAYLLNLIKSDANETNIFSIILGTSLYSSIVGPFVFAIGIWWMRIKTKPRKRF